MKYLLRVSREVIREYLQRLKKLTLVNHETKVRWAKKLKKGFEEKSRAAVFDIIACVEDWTKREKDGTSPKMIEKQ